LGVDWVFVRNPHPGRPYGVMGLNINNLYGEKTTSFLSSHPPSNIRIPPKGQDEVAYVSDRLANYCDPMCGRGKNGRGGILPGALSVLLRARAPTLHVSQELLENTNIVCQQH